MDRRNLLALLPLAWPAAHALAASAATTPDKPRKGLAAEADALFENSFEAGQPGGVLLLRQGETTLYRAAFGSADITRPQRLEPGALMRVGSITKPFTAAGILQLVKAGELRLDDPLSRHLPELKDGGAPVTLRQLLSHTAGLGNYTELPAMRAYAEQGVTPGELLALCAQTPRVAAPGEQYRYSNTGYVLLGAVLERRSGLPFGRYLAQHICAPLELHDTAVEGEERSAKRLVAGHGRRLADGTRGRVPQLHPSLRGAAGALVSTADDLARFALNLQRLLPPDLAALATLAERLADGAPVRQSLLWQLRPLHGRERVEHGGATSGFLSHLLVLPSERLVAVVLMNESTGRQPGPGFMAEQLAALAVGVRTEALRVVRLPVEQLTPLMGRYGAGEDPPREISLYEGQLMVRRGESRALLEAVDPLHFIDRRRDVVHYRFERDGQGRVKGLRIEREGRPPEQLLRQ